MRWSNQSVKEDGAARLPGYEDAVIRRFEAPEALNTRFHEVRTKSALNRVPNGARLPFGWTVNPYRGCSHACTYCSSGDTRVLMGDGSTRELRHIEVGDEIYGTVRRGVYRRLVRTTVLDHWSTIKPAYRVSLADGTELVASGDHRFLSARGWKHVLGDEQGAGRRPHLTLGTKLMGLGRFEAPPVESTDYRRGYLCGLIRGDGHLSSRSYERSNGREWTHHVFRLALADQEALRRAKAYLAAEELETSEFAFQAAAGARRAMRAIITQRGGAVGGIRELISWQREPSEDWVRGFLAGIFDAEGSCDGYATRISNTDPEIVGWTVSCFERLGFEVVVEDTHRSNGLRVVRLLGGACARLRFFHMTAPAVRRNLRLDGLAIKNKADLEVVAIEPVADSMRLYDITTGTGDFIADGVVSHNCFARPTHEYLDLNAAEDFEREIVVKVNVPEVLRAELARPSWKGESVALGTNTDPYQWVEGRYKLMRGIWEAFRDAANPCSILTKSPLVLRDVDLLKQIAEVAEVSACLSVPTLDEKAWRATEPHTPNPRARLEAVGELNRAGIPTGILIAPLMPGINDAPEQVEKIVELATENGAVSIGGNTLFLRGSVRQIFFDWLREHRPDLLPRYEELYRRGAYLPEAQRREIERAAGAPWAGRSYPDRFRHRVGERMRALKEVERQRVIDAAERRRKVSAEQQSLF
jgi:DNA repair photolyase